MRRAIAAALVFVIGTVSGGVALATHVFSDVPDDHSHASGIEWVAERGIMQGFGDGTFRPENPVTRGQLATTLHRQGAYQGPLYTLTPDCGSTTMRAVDQNLVGSGSASVEFSVDGGDRQQIGEIPASGDPLAFQVIGTGVVTLFVDGIAWASTPTGETCTPPSP